MNPHIQKAMELADKYSTASVHWGMQSTDQHAADMKAAYVALESHLLALVERVRKETIEENMRLIDRWIIPGDFGDDGTGKNALRNGLVLAYNELGRALASPVEK